jgi:hypothetical protein
MTKPLYVYIFEQGDYSDKTIGGVYTTPEAAMEAHPVPTVPSYPGSREIPADAAWRLSEYAAPGYQWDNGCDHDSHGRITRYALEGAVCPIVK